MIVATYNVHRCVGADGRGDVERVAAVIRELRPDVIGLQEVASRTTDSPRADQLTHLAGLTGLTPVAGPLLRRPDGHYGNALLSREPVSGVRLLDLGIRRREPRGAIAADVLAGARLVRVVVTHLGLRGRERRLQLDLLLEGLGADHDPTVILADMNEWLTPARSLRRVRAFGGYPVPSFPARWPLLALDRVLVRPAELLVEVRPHASPLARVASDHLPVYGVLREAGEV